MLTIAVLNYNGEGILRKCLQSIRDQTKQPDEIFVIDNASTDKSWYIADEFRYNIIHAHNEHRLITGLNLAQRFCKDWLFFMENDVILNSNCLEEMMNNVQHYERTAIYQPVFYRKDGSIDNSGMDIVWPGYGIGRRKKWWDRYLVDDCGIVSDIAFLTSKEVIEKVGKYDENFSPGYYEDLDWGLRSKKLGIKHRLVTTAKAIHLSNYSYSKVYDKKELSSICHTNRLKLINKHYSGLAKTARVATVNLIDKITGIAGLVGSPPKPPN